MKEDLRVESEKLTRSWMQHDAAKLRDYLVAGVEDPRINLQSILSRHFLLRTVFGATFEPLMNAEYRFSAVTNWLLKLGKRTRDPEELDAVLYGLSNGADNAEGVEIPQYVLQTFARLPNHAGGLEVPNYITSFLSEIKDTTGALSPPEPSLNTFRNLWQRTLLGKSMPGNQVEPSGQLPMLADLQASRTPRVFEPACGSANDYRFLRAYGLSPSLDYTGLDLCAKNIENARAMYPETAFEIGNVFELAAADNSFDYCFTHDLFEHLSPVGLAAAVREICRVTSRGICVGFFNMDEIREHIIRPMDEYHWNTLSMARMKDLFEMNGFCSRVWHIGTFLQQHLGCDETHNPNAYTFILTPPLAV